MKRQAMTLGLVAFLGSIGINEPAYGSIKSGPDKPLCQLPAGSHQCMMRLALAAASDRYGTASPFIRNYAR